LLPFLAHFLRDTLGADELNDDVVVFFVPHVCLFHVKTRMRIWTMGGVAIPRDEEDVADIGNVALIRKIIRMVCAKY
jgi:hypothetical protein